MWHLPPILGKAHLFDTICHQAWRCLISSLGAKYHITKMGDKSLLIYLEYVHKMAIVPYLYMQILTLAEVS